jgi:hypothetical protein
LDAYWFQAAANDNVDIVMRSTALDSFLILQANDGSLNPPFSDDNSGGGRDARLTRRLSAGGVYIIIAFPYAPNVTGAYTLSLNRTSFVEEASGGAPDFGQPASGRVIQPRIVKPLNLSDQTLDFNPRRRFSWRPFAQ